MRGKERPGMILIGLDDQSCGKRLHINGCLCRDLWRFWARISNPLQLCSVITARASTHGVLSPPKWAPCNRHSVGRRVHSSPSHNKGGPLAQRTWSRSGCLHTSRTQSARGATLDQALWLSLGTKKSFIDSRQSLLFFELSTRPTFPTMLLLQKAQWPFAVVRTPIFSRSELSPPSRSSMASVFLLTVVSETALLLLSMVSWSSFASAWFVLSTDCFFFSGGITEGNESCKTKKFKITENLFWLVLLNL